MEQSSAPAIVISLENAEHYRWGGQNKNESDGWYLLHTAGLHVIEERMPPAAAETRHFHTHARQFIYVLEGDLTMEVEHHVFTLRRGQGIEVAPGKQHQAFNRSAAPLRILVVSSPPSHSDRTESP